MDFIAAGNVMVDEVVLATGGTSDIHMGGPSFFALVGMKVWTDDCLLRANVGADFERYFGQWFDHNGVTRAGIEVRADHCNHSIITYHADGSYQGKSVYGLENMGFLRCRPEDVERYCQRARGVYLAQDADLIVWDGLLKVRDQYGYKMMWEIEARWAIPEKLDDIISIAKRVDMFSINMNEASILFGIDQSRTTDILQKIADWGVPYVFLRAGHKGSYAIAGGKATFIPSVGSEQAVDSTGCGNCSTGAAAYAYAAGYSPVEASVMGNISAYFNVLQYGVPEDMAPIRAQAQALFYETMKTYR